MKRIFVLFLLLLSVAGFSQISYNPSRQLVYVRTSNVHNRKPPISQLPQGTYGFNTFDSIIYGGVSGQVVALEHIFPYSTGLKRCTKSSDSAVTGNYSTLKKMFYYLVNDIPGNIPPLTDAATSIYRFINTHDSLEYMKYSGAMKKIYIRYPYNPYKHVVPPPVYPTLDSRIYVTTTGSDTSTNAHVYARAFKTIRKASTVATSGDTIYVAAGTYVENNQMFLATGVSIVGVDSTSTIVSSSYNNGSPSSYSAGLIVLTSTTVNTNGNQVIKGIKFLGNNTCNLCISVNNRSNVTITNCAFEYFVRSAVVFMGPIDSEKYHELPYCVENKFMYNRVTECGRFNSYPLSLTFQGQDQFELGYCKFRDYRSGNNNSDCFTSKACKRWYIHHNDARKPNTVYPYWNAICEIRWNYGECRFTDNYCQGSVDPCWNYYQNYDYSVLIENNHIGFTTLQSGFNAGLTIEADTKRMIVRNNHFFNIATGVSWVPSSLSTVGLDSIIVSNNLFENIGKTTAALAGQYPDAIMFGASGQPTTACKNVYIYNNTAVGGTYSRDGITFGRTGQFRNIQIKNNIVTGFIASPLHFELGYLKTAPADMTVDTLNVSYNNFFGNGNSNAIKYTVIIPTHATVSNQTTTNAVLTTDFKLGIGSPAINAGINVGIPYLGIAPDLGFFEKQ